LSTNNDGRPAFPYGQKNITERSSEGMTLRDYFAGQALAGILSAANFGNAKDWIGQRAYEYADAMLAAREAKK